ncbi:MAG: lysophospholipase [Cyclobacteriaceae bacterium]|nr:lysophospholipase [Cyclobacteriaceae bacterium]
MVLENYHVYSGGGTQLCCTSWQPIDLPKAVLFIVHGLGEHSGRYEEMANVFTKNQIAVFSFDHRGHGRSEGKKGHAESIDQFVEDVEIALMKCRSLFLEIPIFLYGHSMGGQIVASYLDKVKSKEINGAIISSAWFRLVNPPPSWQIKLINKLASIIPRLTISNGINPKIISSVAAEVIIYQKDSLIHDKISVSLFHTLFHNGLHLIHLTKPVKISVLVCHGDKDQITSKLGSEQYANNLGEKAEFKIWPDSFHEPHHDFEKEKVMRFYVDWVKARIIK